MVKQNYTIQLGKMLQPRPNTPQDVEIPYLKAQHVQWFHVRTTDAPKMWAGQSDIVRFGVAPSDLLVCEGGEGGRCGILRQDVKGYIIQNALHRVRPRQQSRNDYLQGASKNARERSKMTGLAIRWHVAENELGCSGGIRLSMGHPAYPSAPLALNLPSPDVAIEPDAACCKRGS